MIRRGFLASVAALLLPWPKPVEVPAELLIFPDIPGVIFPDIPGAVSLPGIDLDKPVPPIVMNIYVWRDGGLVKE